MMRSPFRYTQVPRVVEILLYFCVFGFFLHFACASSKVSNEKKVVFTSLSNISFDTSNEALPERAAFKISLSTPLGKLPHFTINEDSEVKLGELPADAIAVAVWQDKVAETGEPSCLNHVLFLNVSHFFVVARMGSL